MREARVADVPEGTPEEQAAARAAAVQAAADVALADGQIYAAVTPQGEVRICRITSHVEGTATWVEVYLQGAAEGSPPNFRIFNPPLLVADPNGTIEINGQHFREDPMLAVAYAVAEHGGATGPKRPRR